MKRIYIVSAGIVTLGTVCAVFAPASIFAKRVIEPHGKQESAAEKESSDDAVERKRERIKKEYGDDLFIEFYALGKDVSDAEHKAERIASTHLQKQRSVQTLQQTLRDIDHYTENLKRRKAETMFEVEQTTGEIRDLHAGIEERIEELDAQKQLLQKYFGKLYDEKNLSTLEILLRSDTFADALDSTYDLELLEEHGRELYEQVAAESEQLERDKQRLTHERERLAVFSRSLDQQKEALDNARTEKEYLLKATRGEEEMYQRLLTEAQTEMQAVDAELSQLRDVINAIEDPDGKRKLKALEAQLGDAFSMTGTSGFVWPVDPTSGITAYFMDTEYQEFFGRAHQGIDIRAKQGTPLRAAQDGYVFRAADNGYGYSYIILVHGRDLMSVYGHVSSFIAEEGQLVRQGDIIGLSGGTPGSKGAGRMTTGPHVHFEIRKNGTPVDPFDYLPY